MLTEYTFTELLLYVFIYSFIAWVIEVCYHSVKSKRFINRGFLNLPFNISYGIVAVVLLIILPTLDKKYPLQYIAILVVLQVVKSITNFFIENIGRFELYEYIDEEKLANSIQYVSKILLAAVCLLIYVVIHPFVFAAIKLMPDIITKIVSLTLLIITLLDFCGTIFVMRKGYNEDVEDLNQTNRKKTQQFANKIVKSIWKRLEKSYPGVNKASKIKQEEYVFAQGICVDKLIWVFLVSSFLGALIEMVFCYSIDGFWMNRSSVLYGPFSFVWGIGAVVLTVSLRRMINKNIFIIFSAGFVIGGVYEYLCSVFTELVFGTVFWDYSNMPLNIGGRTNVLYCVFWGVLGVVWIKLIYPFMSKNIEKLPAIQGKVITWAIMIVMLCNGVLTASAMMRYTERKTTPEPQNIIQQMLDEQYDDAYIENRWPNMVVI